MNTAAMLIPADRLLTAYQERVKRRADVLLERDSRLGAGRTMINSYMENIGWPDLFGYDMNDYFTNAELALELTLRQSIFWLDNVDHDSGAQPLSVDAGRSYWDITLFGQDIGYTRQGVPLFGPHPLSEHADLALLQPYDFRSTGAMPGIHRRYQDLRRLAASRYDGQIEIGFPHFERGPLDILVQLRGYQNAVADMGENPEFVHRFLALAVEERVRFERERVRFLETEEPRKTIGVADDWVHVPFISPWVFRTFVAPAYGWIRRNEAMVTHFHTCGGYGSLAVDLLETLPDLESIDIVPQCNDLLNLDAALPTKVAFNLNLLSVFTLTAPEEEHRRLLEVVAVVGRRRRVVLCPGAIVRLHDTYDEDIARLNRFIALAREVLAS